MSHEENQEHSEQEIPKTEATIENLSKEKAVPSPPNHPYDEEKKEKVPFMNKKQALFTVGLCLAVAFVTGGVVHHHTLRHMEFSHHGKFKNWSLMPFHKGLKNHVAKNGKEGFKPSHSMHAHQEFKKDKKWEKQDRIHSNKENNKQRKVKIKEGQAPHPTEDQMQENGPSPLPPNPIPAPSVNGNE